MMVMVVVKEDSILSPKPSYPLSEFREVLLPLLLRRSFVRHRQPHILGLVGQLLTLNTAIGIRRWQRTTLKIPALECVLSLSAARLIVL